MKSATLRQRAACGAAPRRCQLPPLRPGVRVSVIVPSKDNASGSSDKRIPLIWTFSDLSSKGVSKHKKALEEAFHRDAPEPEYDAIQELAQRAAQPGSPDTRPDAEAWEPANLDPVVLRERLESAAQASTSAPSTAGHPQNHNIQYQHQHQNQQQQQQQQQQHQQLSQQQESQHHHQQQQQQQRWLSERDQLLVSASTVAGARVASATYDAMAAGVGCRTATVAAAAAANGVTSVLSAGGPPSLHHGGPPQQTLPSPAASVSSSSPELNHHHHHHHQQQPTHSATQNHSHNHNHHHQQHHNHHHQPHQQEQQQPPLLHLHPDQPADEVPPIPHAAAAAAVEADIAAAAASTLAHSPHATAAATGAAGSSNSIGATDMAADAPAAAASATGQDASAAAAAQRDPSIPGSIWILCGISAALTCASCVFNTALPIYMVSELKMSMRSMGMFEGLLEAFSYVVRMCSGVVSDRMTSRKAAITLGFAAGAAAKFGMASAGTVGLLFAGKAVDRLANGIQAAPRDALIGDLSPPGVRSACFGLAQSLRKWGSAVGALAAFFLMKASNNNYQLIFYSAATVSLVACLAFVLFVPAHTRVPTAAASTRTPSVAPTPASASSSSSSSSASSSASQPAAAAASAAAPAPVPAAGPFAGVREFLRSVASMGADFYRMLGVICLYALGHINESLLEARAMEVGFGKAEATLVVAALAAVTFLTAFPLGRLDDKYGAGTTFAVGIGALIAGDLVLLLSGPHPMALFAACLFLGVHWAVIQGPLLSIVSGLAPANLRGTAFGIFYTVMAVTAVGANTMYGSIWHTYGANAAFMTSAALMSVVLAALPYMLPASARRTAASAAPASASGLPAGPNKEGGKGPSLMGAPLPAAA